MTSSMHDMLQRRGLSMGYLHGGVSAPLSLVYPHIGEAWVIGQHRPRQTGPTESCSMMLSLSVIPEL